MTVVKICGVRRSADADLAVRLGARFVGCVVAAQSPRCATLRDVAAVIDAVGADRVVLVTRRSGIGDVVKVAGRAGVDRVQVHGALPSEVTQLVGLGLRCHVVASVSSSSRELPEMRPIPTSDRPGVLDHGSGGSGESFEWGLLEPHGAPEFVFIAGGIDPGNVVELMRYRPWGIDLSQGVESDPGIKDPDRMRALFAALEVAS